MKQIVKANRKYKMNEEELKMFLHMKRKGSNYGNDKKKYNRHKKHKSA